MKDNGNHLVLIEDEDGYYEVVYINGKLYNDVKETEFLYANEWIDIITNYSPITKIERKKLKGDIAEGRYETMPEHLDQFSDSEFV